MRRRLVLLTLLAAACTAKAGGDQLEAKAKASLKEAGLEVTKITCPRSIEVKVGTKFDCPVTFDNGETLTMRGEVTSKSGKNFEYSLNLVEANFVTEKVIASIRDGLTEQVKVTPTVIDCGPPGIHKAPATFSCRVVAADDSSGKVDVTIDEAGKVNWRLVGTDDAPPPDDPAPDADPAGDPTGE